MTFAAVGLLAALGGLGATGAIAASVMAPPVSAQAAIHVLPVTNGGGTCREMTRDLKQDRTASRAAYFNYMAGFVTGANYLAFSVPGRNSNVPSDLPSEVVGHTRADEAVFALLERECAQHPSMNISEAMMHVYDQLLAAAR